MRGSFFLGASSDPKFEVREMEFGSPEAHEVLVRNMACGVCGTDVHIYNGEKGSADVTPPVVLGHEFSGIVEAVGSEVEGIRPGDHVAMDPNIYCGKCRPCRMGKKQNCEHLFALGVNVNGGFAEYCMCPDTQVFKMADDLSFEEAAMAEPLACVVHGIDQANIQTGQSVLVIGGGTIGLLMVQMARLSGAGMVLLSEPVEIRRQIGMEVGADGTIDPISENVPEKIKALTGNDGVDVVIECVGKPFAVDQAFSAAGRGATILLFSVPGLGSKAELPLFEMYSKELKVIASLINPDTHQRAVNLLNSHRLEIKKLITHRYDIDHLEDAILAQMGKESVKVMVMCG